MAILVDVEERTTDPDEAQQSLMRSFGAARFTEDPGPGFEWFSRSFGDADIVVGRSRFKGSTASGTENSLGFLVARPNSSRFIWRIGRESGGPDEPVLLPPARWFEAEYSDLVLSSVMLGAGLMQRTADSLAGREVRVDAEAPNAGAHNLDLVASALDQLGKSVLEARSAFGNDLVRAEVARHTAALVLNAYGMVEPRDGPEWLAPVALRRAIAFMESSAQLPITVDEIAIAARTSVIGLEAEFRRVLGTTPTAYLRRIRLEGAREELRAGEPSTLTVEEVAGRWGFARLSRFEARYQAEYGETPQATLQS